MSTTRRKAIRQFIASILPAMLLGCLVVSAYAAAVSPWADPSVKEYTLAGVLTYFSVLFLAFVVIIVVLLLVLWPFSFIALFRENSERKGVATASAMFHLEVDRAKDAIDTVLRKLRCRGRCFKLPGNRKYVLASEEDWAMWLPKLYVVLEKDEADTVRVTYAVRHRWLFRFRRTGSMPRARPLPKGDTTWRTIQRGVRAAEQKVA